MKNIFIFLTLIMVLFNGCSATKVHTAYDRSFDMKVLKNFYVVQSNNRVSDPLTINRISGALANELEKKGYKLTSQYEADFFVHYYVNAKNKSQLITDYSRVGSQPFRQTTMMIPTTKIYNYKEGKLVIEMVETKKNRAIFRASMRDQLKELGSDTEKTIYINSVVEEILKEFPKTLF